LKAFVVSVNGRRLCTAGVGPEGVLSAIVTWVGRGSRRPAEGKFDLHVGGLDSRTGEHLGWKTPRIRVGDSVTVKLVETERVDAESKRYVPDPSGGGQGPRPKATVRGRRPTKNNQAGGKRKRA